MPRNSRNGRRCSASAIPQALARLAAVGIMGMCCGSCSAWAAEPDAATRLVAARQVTLNVHERAAVARTNWPVSQGVAFAPGALTDLGRLRLRGPDGRPTPLSARALAWWDRERTAIRFAQITFAADVPAGAHAQYLLSWHEEGKANAPPVLHPLTVARAPDALTVTTGDFSVRFSLARPLLWEAIRLGGRSQLDPAVPATLFVTRQDGVRFAMHTARSAYRVEVEEESPLRVVVKQSGMLASQDGQQTFCQYEIRHIISAGQPWVQLQPRVFFTCDWPDEWLRGYGLELALAAPIRTLTSGVDGKSFTVEPNRGAVQILQAEDNELLVGRPGEHSKRPGQCDGFVQCDTLRPLTVAVRDFWQQHPCGFLVEGNRLTVKLWADESGRELTFDRHWTLRNTVFLAELPGVVVANPAVPEGKEFSEAALCRELRKLPRGTWVNLRMGNKTEVIHLDSAMLDRIAAEFKGQVEFFANDMFPLGGLHSPRGRAKSHDLLFAFGPLQGATLAAAWQHPLYAIAPPLYTCGTGALGRLRGREPGRFPEAENILLDAAQLEAVQAVWGRRNGWLHHGSLLNWHNNPGFQYVFQIYGKDAGFRPHQRLGVCTAGSTLPGGGMQRGAWLMFAYTGSPDWLDFAQRITGHLIDIDTCHLEYRPKNRSSLGYLAGEGLTPWSSWGNIIQSYVGMMHHYCFTGDPRALEAARLVSGWVINEYEQAWDKAYETYIYDYTVRAWYIPAVSLLEYYWLTWDDHALQTVDRMWERIQARRQRNLPLLLLPNHRDIFICTLHELHPDPAVRAAAAKALLQAADRLLQFYAEQPRQLAQTNLLEFRLLAQAYALTANQAYVELARERLRRLPIAGLHGEWYGGYPAPGWPGMAASCIPWIFPALHQQQMQEASTR